MAGTRGLRWMVSLSSNHAHGRDQRAQMDGLPLLQPCTWQGPEAPNGWSASPATMRLQVSEHRNDRLQVFSACLVELPGLELAQQPYEAFAVAAQDLSHCLRLV